MTLIQKLMTQVEELNESLQKEKLKTNSLNQKINEMQEKIEQLSAHSVST